MLVVTRSARFLCMNNTGTIVIAATFFLTVYSLYYVFILIKQVELYST